MGLAAYYSRTRQNGITATERTLIAHANTAVEEALNTTNSFFEDEWSKFKTEMERTDVSPFKPVETFKLKN
jgi:hypothetical protein